MRIEIVNDEDIDIFINAYQFNGINLKDKEVFLIKYKNLLEELENI